jgi:hypothetical protein
LPYGIEEFTLSRSKVAPQHSTENFSASSHEFPFTSPIYCADRVVLKKSGGYLLLFIFIGGLLGSILGEILQIVSPQGMVRSIFGEALSLGLDPPVTVNLVLVKFTLGFLLRINLLSVLGMLLGAYLYKHI